MALRDQPYIPLYIQDIMTDEKLNECSASTHGIYIKGIMCLMHKSDYYGKILLKQKYKQSDNICLGFALQLDKHLPYTTNEIEKAIQELLDEKVCYIENDFLCQKRMIKDNELSIKRSEAGREGGKKTQSAKAKIKANSEDENEIVINNENINAIIKLQYPNFNNSEFKETLFAFQEHRQLLKKPFTDYALREFITELSKLSNNNVKDAIQIMKKSLKAGYPDIYELKDGEITTTRLKEKF